MSITGPSIGKENPYDKSASEMSAEFVKNRADSQPLVIHKNNSLNF